MEIQNTNTFGNVKILMLKGEKGDKGDGSYNDSELRSMIAAETTARGRGDATLDARINNLVAEASSGLMNQEIKTFTGQGVFRSDNDGVAMYGTVFLTDIDDPSEIDVLAISNTYTYIPGPASPEQTMTVFFESYDITFDQSTEQYFITAYADDEVFPGADVTTEGTATAYVLVSSEYHNAELEDIRVGFDGTVYESAGAAVRAQIEDVAGGGSGGSGITSAVKTALLNLLAHVAYTDQNGQTYYDALEEALYPLSSISAVFTQGENVVYNTDNLNSLKQYLVVTAIYEDSHTDTVTDYALSGTLTEGTSTITVSYMGKTTTFNVTVTAAPWLYRLLDSAINKEYIDTGVKLFDTNKDFTVAFDIDITGTNGSGAYRLVDGLDDGTGVTGINIGRYSTQNYLNFRYYNNYKKSTGSFSVPGRVRLVATHSAGSGSMTVKYRIGTGTTTNTDSVSGTYLSQNHTIKIASSHGDNFLWTGTVHSFYLYDRVFSATEINEYLGV